MSKENQSLHKIIPVIQTILPEGRGNFSSRNELKEQYLNELLFVQYQVNQQLLINNYLTEALFKSSDEPNGKATSSEGSTLPGKGSKEQKKQKQKYSFADKKKKIKIKQNSQSDYQPSQQQEPASNHKLSESKNVPKNYGKAITNFISKNDEYVMKVLSKHEINMEKFKEYALSLRNKINTILELRQIWIQSKKNPFAKVLRIISVQYLRKHCLSHIFNSRVQNYAKHIKYRLKLTEAVQKPEQFTNMKDF